MYLLYAIPVIFFLAVAMPASLVFAWLAPGNRPPWLFPDAASFLAFSAVLMNMAAALYASWTQIGKMTIDGAPGRYLLPVLPLLAFMAAVYGPKLARLLSPAWLVVVVFPLVSMATLPAAGRIWAPF